VADEKILKRNINEYLFAEFSFDWQKETTISENWPFELQALGLIQMPTDNVHIFEFSDNDEPYFAVSGPSLNFYPTAGMTINDLRLQMIGSAWIAGQEPIDLNTVRLGDESVPSVRERRTAIEALAAKAFSGEPLPQILEGLFLRATDIHLALVQSSISEDAVVIGSVIEPKTVGFPLASVWRRLSFGIGQIVTEGKLKE
jgi:hypothetical protein